MLVSLLLCLLPLLYVIRTLYNLNHNIRLARSIGLPYILHPYFESTIAYALMIGPLGDFFIFVASMISKITNSPTLLDRVKFGTLVRRHHVKNRIHEQYGQVVVLVSPGGLNVLVAEAIATAQVLGINWSSAEKGNGYRGGGGGKFLKAPKQYKMIEIYGRNVVTVSLDPLTWYFNDEMNSADETTIPYRRKEMFGPGIESSLLAVSFSPFGVIVHAINVFLLTGF